MAVALVENCSEEVPARPGPRGVGFACHLALPDALYTPELINFIEITPELFHHEENVRGSIELLPDRKVLDAARRRCEGFPITMHGVSLSIGSAHGMYEPCLAMMDRLRQEWPFYWYSEHLQFQLVLDSGGSTINTGTPFPLPPTKEAAELVARRAAAIQGRLGVPFLLENPVHYLPDLPADPEIGDEFGLMARIVALSGCEQLLDLHNVYCNAINFGFDARSALDRVRLDRVGEIHIAGGSWSDGFYTDAHDGRVPEPVWDLLAETLSRMPQIPAVVFEILEEYVDQLGPDGIAGELERAGTVWRQYQQNKEVA